jgi:hypothetical protein
MKAGKQTKPSLLPNILENKKTIKKSYNELKENNQESSLLDCSAEIMDKVINILGFVNENNDHLLSSLQKLIEQASDSWPDFKKFISIVNT